MPAERASSHKSLHLRALARLPQYVPGGEQRPILEVLVVAHDDYPLHHLRKVLQLVDHLLPSPGIKVPESLIDDQRANAVATSPRVLADTRSQSHGRAELLPAGDELHVERLIAGGQVYRLDNDLFLALRVRLASQPHLKLAAGDA